MGIMRANGYQHGAETPRGPPTASRAKAYTPLKYFPEIVRVIFSCNAPSVMYTRDMKAPKCRVCGELHYGICGRAVPTGVPIVSMGARPVTEKRSPVTKPDNAVTETRSPVIKTSDVTEKRCPTCGKKIGLSAADRQRRYRERKNA